MLLSSMRAASFGDSLTGSDNQQFYQGMFDDQLSVELTKGRGLGLAELLVEQLTRAGLAGAGTTNLSTTAGAANAASSNATLQPWEIQHDTRSSAPASTRAAGAATSVSAEATTAQWRPATREDFVRDLWPHAQSAAQ